MSDVRISALCAPAQAAAAVLVAPPGGPRGPGAGGGPGREPQQTKDGPERNSGVFPQEAEPEAGRGGAGEPEHLEA